MKNQKTEGPVPGAPCASCAAGPSRRRFLRHCGLWVGGAGLGLAGCSRPGPVPVEEPAPIVTPTPPARPVRVGLVSVCAPPGWNVWPYVNFDYETRKREIAARLAEGCPGIELVPLTVQGTPEEEIAKVRKLAEGVDGLLVFLLCTNWGLTRHLLPAVGALETPAVFVDELYAGSGVFLCDGARTLRGGHDVILLSTSRFDDVNAVTRCFSLLGEEGRTPADFLTAAERVRRSLFAGCGDLACTPDPVVTLDPGDVIRRLEETKILRVIGKKGNPYKALGAAVEPVSFDEINAVYGTVDRDEAAQVADRWIAEAAEVVEPSRDDIVDAGSIYLAMKALMAQRGAQGITIDCLGGFYSGKLPGYPCLGYRQLNDDGVVAGTCEAQIPDMLAMLICRYMFDRASFASDPVLDTATNRIIYAHCVAPTRMLGADVPANPFRIRSHAEDGKGAAIQSILPTGYMTTSFRMTHNCRQLAIHQAKAVGNVDEPKACRTKLAAEVRGDIGKLFHEWDRFSWHRLTVYGDLQEEIEELAGALKMEVIREA